MTHAAATSTGGGGTLPETIPTTRDMKAFPVIIIALASAAVLSFAEDARPKPYPLKNCIISGEKLGTMGKPAVTVVDGQEVQFCCKDCLKDFNKDPKKYLKEIAEKAKSKGLTSP